MADTFPFPLSGDPDVLDADGRMYAETADAINRAIGDIRRLASGSFDSDAVRALQRRQGDVATDISHAYGRYRAAGDALVEYARELRHAQEQANAALAAFHDAGDAATTLQYRISDATQQATTPGPEQGMYQVQLAQLAAEHQQVQAVQQDARQRWQEAADLKTGAADRAAIAINAGNTLNDLNDDFWDDLGDIADVLGIAAGFAKAVLSVLAKAMTFLGTVASMLSMIVPGLGVAAAALYSTAQLVNIAVATLTILQDVLRGANVFDAVIATLAIIVSAASAMTAAAAAAGVAAGAARVAGIVGVSVDPGLTGEFDRAAQTVSESGTNAVLTLGGDDAESIYDDAQPDLDPRLDGAAGVGVSSALGQGDRLTGWWASAAGLDHMPTSVMPGGVASGADATAGPGAAGGSAGAAGYGEQPGAGLQGLGTSMAQDFGHVFVPQADGVAFHQAMGAFAPPDGSQAVGDLATGITHDLLGQHAAGWAAAATHAVGGGTAGVSAVGGTWSGVQHALPDALGAGGHTTSITDALGGRVSAVTGAVDGFGQGMGGDEIQARIDHYFGFDTQPVDQFGMQTIDMTDGLSNGAGTALMGRTPDGARVDFFTSFSARTPGHGQAWW